MSAFRPATERSWLNLHFLELDSLSGLQALARPCYALEEAWIVLQLVVEPIVFRGKSHQDTRGLPVPGARGSEPPTSCWWYPGEEAI